MNDRNMQNDWDDEQRYLRDRTRELMERHGPHPDDGKHRFDPVDPVSTSASAKCRRCSTPRWLHLQGHKD